MRRSTALWVAIATAPFLDAIASAEPVRLVRLAPETQLVAPEGLVPVRPSVRAERLNGQPIVGLTIQFGINACIPVPLVPDPCPTDAEYGGFERPGQAGDWKSVVATGPDGVATAEAYRVGARSPERLALLGPLVIDIYPYVPPQVAGGIEVTVNDSLDGLSSSPHSIFEVTQGGGGAPAIPTLDPRALIVLALACGGAGVWAMRRR
jgi:hypothetical protein